MNDGFLLAECVFAFLADSGFMYNKEWKHDTKELYYTVSFFKQGTYTAVLSFEIVVTNGLHVVAKSNIRLLEKRYSQDFSMIFTRCALPVEK